MAVSKVSNIKTTETTVTTSTEKYDGYYYADTNVAVQGKLLNAYIRNSPDNHLSFIGFCSQSATTGKVFIRAWSVQSAANLTIIILTL
jgi:hypothetical protein